MMIKTDANKKNISLEWQDSSGYIIGRGSTLYYADDNLKVKSEIILIGNKLLSAVLAHLPLLCRIFRLHFYNIYRFENGILFISFGKKYYVLKNSILTEINFDRKFRVLRGGIARNGKFLYFGEYINNPKRSSVNVYKLNINNLSFEICYTFPKNQIRHIHNVIYNKLENSFYVFTGDAYSECRIVKFSEDFMTKKDVASGGEDNRVIVAWVANGRVVGGTDCERQRNDLFNMTPNSRTSIELLNGPVFHGIQAQNGFIVSTAYEGSVAQIGNSMDLYMIDGTGESAKHVLSVKKDRWPTKGFQFGQILFPNTESCPSATYGFTRGAEGGEILIRIDAHRLQSMDSDLALC